MQSFKLRYGVEVTDGDLSDIVCAGLECGGYASLGVACFAPEEPTDEQIPQWVKDRGDAKYKHLWMCIADGVSMQVYDVHEEKEYELTRDKLVKGVRSFFTKYPHFYKEAVYEGEFDTGAIDAAAADSILQLAVFGEVVYA